MAGGAHPVDQVAAAVLLCQALIDRGANRSSPSSMARHAVANTALALYGRGHEYSIGAVFD
ncbi:hypothetical protein GCM10010399_37360 [Dactylosporangium fulvum]